MSACWFCTRFKNFANSFAKTSITLLLVSCARINSPYSGFGAFCDIALKLRSYHENTKNYHTFETASRKPERSPYRYRLSPTGFQGAEGL